MATRKLDRKLDHSAATGDRHHVSLILVDRENLLQECVKLNFAEPAPGLDVCENLLQITYAGRKALHLAK
jgi:hypothetical protein